MTTQLQLINIIIIIIIISGTTSAHRHDFYRQRSRLHYDKFVYLNVFFILVCIVITMELVNFLFCVAIWILISFKELGKIVNVRLFNINIFFLVGF